jgi:serine protease Do
MSRRSGAYEAGLRPGDVIKSVNGQAVANTSQFVRLIADSPIGSTARLEFLRDGKLTSVRLTVERQQPRQARRGR